MRITFVVLSEMSEQLQDGLFLYLFKTFIFASVFSQDDLFCLKSDPLTVHLAPPSGQKFSFSSV